MTTANEFGITGFCQDPLVWIDLEMTGLDLAKDQIIEIAVIITDGNLNVIAEGPELVIRAEKQLLDGMDAWCTTHHGESGLTAASLASPHTTQSAESAVLAFIRKHVPTARLAPMAGNSIHVDKTFLQKEMPNIVNHLHYRIVDVSTIKECVKRWLPRIADEAPSKEFSHRALDDIRESIEELKYYRRVAFVQD
ncbi:hypothetical protein HKX48_003809 [Thoreauomyces humboldtii]|nr:hypothetical protein HKX48_003809 [Thoreauomyces humboldtii]